MLNSTLNRVASAAIVMAAFAAPAIANAETMEFVSYDGSWQVQGQLQSYDDTLFRIGTDLGILTVSAKLIMCHGAECPTPAQIWSDVQSFDTVNAAQGDQSAEMSY